MEKARVMVLLLLAKLEHTFSQKRNLEIALGVTLVIVVGIIALLFFLSPKKQETKPPEIAKNQLAAQAKAYILAFSKTSINPLFAVPSILKVEATKNEKGIVTNQNRYTASWNIANRMFGSFSVLFKDVSIFDSTIIQFTLSEKIYKANETSADILVNTFFTIKPKSNWVCDTTSFYLTSNEKVVFCQNAWVDKMSGIKREEGVIFSNKPYIYYCERYPGSKKFDDSTCMIHMYHK